MNLTNLRDAKSWQVAAGNGNISYHNICLDLGIIMMGPGRFGPWLKGEKNELYEKLDPEYQKNKKYFKRFYSINTNDVIVLKEGKKNIRGVGLAKSKAKWNSALDDVDGWDLQHYIEVQWLWKDYTRDVKIKPITNHEFGIGTIFDFPYTTILLSWLSTQQMVESSYKPFKPPAELEQFQQKEDSNDLSNTNILCRKLYDYGISDNNLSELKGCISELQSLASWYENYNTNVSEAETTSHLVVPLLKALGWTSQRICLEYKNSDKKSKRSADLALYNYGKRSDEYITAIVEVKKLRTSCLTAGKQVHSYTNKDHTKLQLLIVTDGIRYGIFKKEKCDHSNEEEVSTKLYAYLNLLNPKDEYQIYNSRGGDEALLCMSADWKYDFEPMERDNSFNTSNNK